MRWKLIFKPLTTLLIFNNFIMATEIPLAPTNAGVYNITEDSIRLSFLDNADNEKGFIVYHQGVVIGTAPAKAGRERYQYINLIGLKPSSLYTVNIVAYNTQGESLPLTKSFRTIKAPPATKEGTPNRPTNIAVYKETPNSVRVSFLDNADNEEGFRIEDLSGNVLMDQIPAKKASGHYQYVNLQGLNAGKLYFIRLFAYNVQGDSAPSITKAFRTPKDQNNTIESNNTSDINLSVIPNQEEPSSSSELNETSNTNPSNLPNQEINISSTELNSSSNQEENISSPIITISKENNQSLKKTIEYPEITLELNSQNTHELIAINQTLIEKENKKIPIKGIKNGDTFYVYSIPLTKGSNEINLTATSDKGVETSKLFTISTDLNSTLPIQMHATKYSAIEILETNITIDTSLDATEYLLDINRDGIIDEVNDNGHFSLTLIKEGVYQPRVTIRTHDGLLFSSDYFALSLEVKKESEQNDPPQTEPIVIAKKFVASLLADDRKEVELLLAKNQRVIDAIYHNEDTLALFKNIYRHIIEWQWVYHSASEASVKIKYEIDGETYAGGFEMNTVNQQQNRGRFWMIRFIY